MFHYFQKMEGCGESILIIFQFTGWILCNNYKMNAPTRLSVIEYGNSKEVADLILHFTQVSDICECK